MAHWVTIWRAAQLVQVPRGVLQQRVRSGEIELADGLVSTDQLLALYPQAVLKAGEKDVKASLAPVAVVQGGEANVIAHRREAPR